MATDASLRTGYNKSQTDTLLAAKVSTADIGNAETAAGAALNATYARRTGPSLVMFGDSRTSDCWFDDSTNFTSTNVDWFAFGQAAATGGPRFNVIANAGTGSNTTTQMQARLQADVIDLAPDAMTIWGGTNDGWTTTADVDTTIVRMKAMIGDARDAGIHVFAISETTSSAKGSTFPSLVGYYNSLMRAWCATQAGVEWWDFNSVIVDPTDTTGYPATGMLRDGTHLSVLGAATIGRDVVAPSLSRLGHPITSLIASMADVRGTNAAARNINYNPLMTGSGGTVSGASHSGSLPDGWTSTGAHTVVWSVESRDDGIGNDIKAVITSSGSGTIFLSRSLNVAHLTAGKTYVLECELAIDAADGLYRTTTAFRVTSPTLYTFATRHQSFTASATETLPVIDQVVRSREFTVPAGITVSAAEVLFSISMSKAGSGTLRIGRLSVRQID